MNTSMQYHDGKCYISAIPNIKLRIFDGKLLLGVPKKRFILLNDTLEISPDMIEYAITSGFIKHVVVNFEPDTLTVTGKIYDCTLYDHALSNDEIKILYKILFIIFISTYNSIKFIYKY